MTKNVHFDYFRRQAKAYTNKWKASNRWTKKDNWHYCAHVIDGTKLTYWYDISFMHHSQAVEIWFIHPRMEYLDKIGDMAYERASPEKTSDDDWLGTATPIFKKLGKNKKRKRVIAYKTAPLGASSRAFFDDITQWETRLMNDNDVVVRPSMRVQQYRWGKGIDLCMPFEIHSEDDVAELVKRVRAYMDDRPSFDADHAAYTYSISDAKAEGLKK